MCGCVHQVLVRALFDPAAANAVTRSPPQRFRNLTGPSVRTLSPTRGGGGVPPLAVEEDISETTAARWSDDRVADMSSFFRPAAAAAKSMQTLFSASLDKFVFAVYSMKDLYNKVRVD